MAEQVQKTLTDLAAIEGQKIYDNKTLNLEKRGNPDERKERERENKRKTLQELRMLSRSLSDCQSLALNVMARVSQFVRKSQLWH